MKTSYRKRTNFLQTFKLSKVLRIMYLWRKLHFNLWQADKILILYNIYNKKTIRLLQHIFLTVNYFNCLTFAVSKMRLTLRAVLNLNMLEIFLFSNLFHFIFSRFSFSDSEVYQGITQNHDPVVWNIFISIVADNKRTSSHSDTCFKKLVSLCFKR